MLPDGSRSVLHGTIEGLLEPPGAAMTIRVIQWATGAVGAAQLREVVDRPDLELVGLFVYDPAKVGVDAGELVGRPPTGVAATNDEAAILALDADVVLHAASKAFPENTNTDDIVALLESGKSVITTTSYNHLPTFGADADRRIRHACARRGHAVPRRRRASRASCSNASPRRSPPSRSASTGSRCRSSSTAPACRARRCSSTSWAWGSSRKTSPSSRRCSARCRCSTSRRIGATADVLGLELDEIRHSVETGTVDHDVEVACGTLPAGSVVGQIMSWSGYRDGEPVLVAQEYWTVTDDIPGWDLDLAPDLPRARHRGGRAVDQGRPHHRQPARSVSSRARPAASWRWR